jgi:hypothetical protein
VTYINFGSDFHCEVRKMKLQVRGMTGVLVVLYATIMVFSALSGGAAAKVMTGEVKVYTYGNGNGPNIEPYIDAMDCIEMRGVGICNNPDTSGWPHTATITVKGAQYGETQATVKLRIEGKGDPLNISVPQQTMLVTDDSGSMVWNDPNNLRFDAGKLYTTLVTLPDEIGFVIYADTLPNNQYTDMRSPLTTNYQSVQNGMYGSSNGATPMIYAFQTANDELMVKKKQGFSWNIIHLTDGCYNTGGDPQPQVDRMVNEQIRLFDIGLYPDPNSQDKLNCEPNLIKWSQQTNGMYFWVQNPSQLNDVYRNISKMIKQDIAGKSPKNGAPMITFQLDKDIAVVPRSFRGSVNYNPTSPSAIGPNNRGLRLEWQAPIKELKISQYWEVSFNIESWETGLNRKVNDVSRSYVEYDRYDGSPGGSDKFELLVVNVNNDITPPPPWGWGEPGNPAPPPPSGGIPQLIPAPQQIPITYLQNLPLIQSMTQAQFLPIQYFLGSLMGICVADRIRMKSRIRQGVKIAIAAM